MEKSINERMLEGEFVVGTMLSEMACPNLVRLLQTAGFDFIVVDCEHGYFDYTQVAALVSVANGFRIPLIVRVPNAGREAITKVMDMGADGILVPMLNTVEDAKRVVSYAKYPPLGCRGVSTQRAHTNYAPPKLTEYFETANRRTMIFGQIETRQGINNLPEIAAVDGIDVIIMGPNDLSVDLGVAGELTSPQIFHAVQQMAQAAKAAHKPSGIITANQDLIRFCYENDMRVFGCDSEVGMLLKMAKSVVKTMREYE